MEIVESASVTDTGRKRSVNEDAALALADAHLFVVADGTGGRDAGDVAASMVVQGLREGYDELLQRAQDVVASQRSSESRLAFNETFEGLIQRLDSEIAMRAREEGRKKMAATAAAVTLVGTHAFIAHVGDVRVYLLREGRLRRLTDDHTVAMLRLRRGKMTPEEYRTSPLRNRLYQALGADGDCDVATAEVRLANNDVYLLCSDGVHNQVEAKQILEVLRTSKTLKGAAERLVELANQAGGVDNATAVLFRVGVDEQANAVESIAAVLRSVFLFRALAESERAVLAPYFDQQVLDAGEQLFAEGDPGDSFYVVLKGIVSITKGETHLVDVGPGGHFGEMCLSRPVPRSATVSAKTQVTVLGLSRERFGEILQRRPGMGARLAMAVLDTVGNRLRDTTERLYLAERVTRGHVKPKGLKPRDAILAALSGKLQVED